MADSLRDQLLKAGLVSTSKKTTKNRPDRREGPDQPRRRGGKGRATQTPARTDEELDLARAYALRAKSEAAERRREKAEAERQARLRRERKQELTKALQGVSLNKPDAELMRHFEYGGKIRRVHVDAEQLARLNAGELAVVQQAGRYILVTCAVADRIAAFAPEHIALRVQPGEGVDDDGIPDGLVW